MATNATLNPYEVTKGINDENWKVYVAQVPPSNAGDTLTLQLPSEWVDIPYNGWGISSVFVEDYIYSTGTSPIVIVQPGARVKTSIAIASYTYSELTGLISVTLGSQPVAQTSGSTVHSGNLIVNIFIQDVNPNG